MLLNVEVANGGQIGGQITIQIKITFIYQYLNCIKKAHRGGYYPIAALMVALALSA